MAEERKEFVPSAHLGYDVFDVDQLLVPEGHVGIFTMRIPVHVTPVITEHFQNVWKAVWRNAGVPNAPALLVIGPGMELAPLHDAKLREMGYVRMTDDKTAETCKAKFDNLNSITVPSNWTPKQIAEFQVAWPDAKLKFL